MENQKKKEKRLIQYNLWTLTRIYLPTFIKPPPKIVNKNLF